MARFAASIAPHPRRAAHSCVGSSARASILGKRPSASPRRAEAERRSLTCIARLGHGAAGRLRLVYRAEGLVGWNGTHDRREIPVLLHLALWLDLGEIDVVDDLVVLGSDHRVAHHEVTE